MNEPKTSIKLQEKSGAGISPIILASIVLLVVVVLYGIYDYVSGLTSSETKPEEGFGPGTSNRSEFKKDAPLPSKSETGELSPKHPDAGIEDESDQIDAKTPLPALDESDDFARNILAGLSSRGEYARWIGADHLIQKITIVVDNVSRGAIPASRIRHLAPKGKFPAIEKSPNRYLMDPQGYHRYDVYADILASVDISAALKVYRTLKPLFDLSYKELGYPEGNFEQVLRRAIKHLLAAPVVSGQVALSRPSVMYKFADPELESLSRAQKQLVRMGPRNTQIIQSVLRSFLTKVGQTDFQTVESNVSDGG